MAENKGQERTALYLDLALSSGEGVAAKKLNLC